MAAAKKKTAKKTAATKKRAAARRKSRATRWAMQGYQRGRRRLWEAAVATRFKSTAKAAIKFADDVLDAYEERFTAGTFDDS